MPSARCTPKEDGRPFLVIVLKEKETTPAKTASTGVEKHSHALDMGKLDKSPGF